MGKEVGYMMIFVNVGCKELVILVDFVGKIVGVMWFLVNIVGVIDIY